MAQDLSRARRDRNVVATLRVHAAIVVGTPDEGKFDDDLYVAALDSRIGAGIRDRVADHLGPEFTVDLEVERSRSIEIVATILLIGSVVASYNSLREGLVNLRHDVKWLVDEALSPHMPFPLTVGAHYELGPAARNLPTMPIEAAPAPAIVGPAIPERVRLVAYSLLFTVLLGWLVVPLLLVANVL